MGRMKGILAPALILTALLAGCSAMADRAVMTTDYPLYAAVENVAGGVTFSRGILEAGDGALTDGDRTLLSGHTALLIGSGAEEYLTEAAALDETMTVTTAGGGEAGLWAGVRGYMTEVRAVTDALIRWDPAHEREYRAGSEEYLDRLTELDAMYDRVLSEASGQAVMLFGDTFGTLFTDYGLEVVNADDGTLTEQRMADLVSACREKDVRLLAVDAGADPSAAESVSAQTGIPLVALEPVSGAGEDGDDRGRYVAVMTDNLNRIARELVWDAS